MAGGDDLLHERDLAASPFEQFAWWYEAAADVVAEPNAAALATADRAARPSLRMVLLKAWQPPGFVFHTNYGSRKAAELDANPRAALMLHWPVLRRQVRIEGSVAKVPDWESDRYFASRPRGGQIGAHASRQSAVVASREELDRAVAETSARFEGRPVPRPPWWGGYRVTPDAVEFWQHRDDRLHDRLVYRPDGRGGWRVLRLQP